MDLLLIGGVSGSGKSVALAAFEDAGYYAVNNLPPTLLTATAAYLARSAQERVAVALDVKTGPGLPGLAEAIAEVRRAGWTVRFLYLDAKTDTLVKRFSETRRRHPFSSNERTLPEAIEYERGLLAEARAAGSRTSSRSIPQSSRCCSNPSDSSTACRWTPISSSTCAAFRIRITSPRWRR